jgi:hypothetical protein
MKNSTRISVDRPCSEKFENFSVTSNGGFCDSCSKEVIDFTRMTDQQVLSHFKISSGETCGRFKKSQLKTYESNTFTQMKPNYISGTIGMLSFSLLALCAAPNVMGQETASNDLPIKTEMQIIQGKTLLHSTAIEKHTVKGVVLDEDNLPLPGANVVLKGTSEGTTADIDGKFEFPRQLETGDVLVFSYIGFVPQEYKIETSESEVIDITITFKYDDIDLMGEVVVGGAFASKRNIFQKFADLFRK